jgi:hypothetical protein
MTGHVIPLAGARAAARAAARDRHPAARSWAPDRSRVLQRLAERAGRRGAPWPRVAAAVVLLRGVAGDDRVAFARRVGLPVTALADLELGVTPPSGIPDRLRQVPDLVDWRWVDADLGGGDQGF